MINIMQPTRKKIDLLFDPFFYFNYFLNRIINSYNKIMNSLNVSDFFMS